MITFLLDWHGHQARRGWPPPRPPVSEKRRVCRQLANRIVAGDLRLSPASAAAFARSSNFTVEEIHRAHDAAVAYYLKSQQRTFDP